MPLNPARPRVACVRRGKSDAKFDPESECLCEQMLAIFEAAFTGSIQELERLYKEDSTLLNLRPDVYGRSTPLMVSVERGHLAASEFLVKHGAELDCQDGYGRTALSYAVHKGHREIIQLLLGCGARPFLPNAFFVFNPGCLLRLLEVSVLCLEPDHPSEISSPNPDRKLKRSPKGHTS